MHAIRRTAFLFALLGLPLGVSSARGDEPVSAAIEIDAGAKPGTMSIVWSLQGPRTLPLFTVDPAKLRVTFRRVGASAAASATPVSPRPIAASSVTMTNFDAVQAFVQYRDVAVTTGSYVVDADASDALTWNDAKGNVVLKLPSTYVYVSNVDTARQPDAEIRALSRAYASHEALARMPFVVACQDAGLRTVMPNSRIGVTSFARTASRQTGNGIDGIHAIEPAGPNGVGEIANDYVSVAAIDVVFANAEVFGKSRCKVASIPFASRADVARYLRPVPH